MNKNVLILFFLLLMAAAAIYSVTLFKEVEKEKQQKQLALNQRDTLLQQNAEQQRKIDSLTIATISELSEKNTATGTTGISNTDTAKNTLIKKLKNANEDYIKRNDATAYQTASKLEKEGFTAIADNKFDVAYEKFKQIIAIAPSFHSSYEIFMLLGKQKGNFNNPETQQKIKEQIVKNYTWKAPQEQLKRIETQVKQANTPQIKVSTLQVQQAVKSTSLNNLPAKPTVTNKAVYNIKQ